MKYPKLVDAVKWEKQNSSNSPFQAVLDSLADVNGRTLLPELEQTAQRTQALSDLLTGQTRETSYRHQIQSMDAGEVFSTVSSPASALNLIYLAALAAPEGWRVELGSAFGIGTIAICQAELDTQNPVDGIEFEDWRAEIANEGVIEILQGRAAVHPGRIEDVLPQQAPHRPKIGFAFVDAMHTYEATIGYHKLIESHATPGALVLYDDLAWSKHMERAWKDIVASPSVTDAIRIDRRWGLVRYDLAKDL